ncbi:MAG: hypothetical protein M0022_03235 [Desulfobacteraceae bacterium]|nr:hypothetical protein [Desulfobacteraceae bacterium]
MKLAGVLILPDCRIMKADDNRTGYVLFHHLGIRCDNMDHGCCKGHPISKEEVEMMEE